MQFQWKFHTVTGAPVEVVSASITLVFLISNGKERKTNTEILLFWAEANWIAWKISKTLIDSDISRDKFTLVINEKQNYFRLKGSIRAKDNQLGDIEQNRLLEHGKRIWQNERQHLKLKTNISDWTIKSIEIIRQCCHISPWVGARLVSDWKQNMLYTCFM